MKTGLTIVVLVAAVVGLQAVREQQETLGRPTPANEHLLYVRSPEFMKRAALEYDSLLADIYWIRAVQHYGQTKLSPDANKNYDLLFPLLDLTTSLEPGFSIAYRFGAIFLAEPYPAGAGRTDLAIALLQKGLKQQPNKWEYVEDIGFIYYWWNQDYAAAAQWFMRASDMPGAPNWLSALAAVTLAKGGNRESSRRLWTEVLNSPDASWLKQQATFRLSQLDAMDQIATLESVVRLYRERTGMAPQSWFDLNRAGYIRGIPTDPSRHPYQLNPESGAITLAKDSPLNPLPAPEKPQG